MYGSVQGPALNIFHDTTMAHCAEECTKHESCRSFVWIPEQSQCELNEVRIPNEKATIGVIFCSSTKKGKDAVKMTQNFKHINILLYKCIIIKYCKYSETSMNQTFLTYL